jgi:hypothetical protein
MAEPGHCTKLPPSVAVSRRRILRTLHSPASPVPGGGRSPLSLGMKLRLAMFLVALLSVAQHCKAEENAVLMKASEALTRLRAECDVPGQTNAAVWTAYVSATEKARHEVIAQLKTLGGEIAVEVRRELEHARGEYREMLVITLAALGDEKAVTQASELMLHSERPAVRVCAAWELRGLKDKRTLAYFKQALQDPYKRKDGSRVQIADGMVYPVRIIASDALVDLGVPFDEVRKLRGDVRH